MALTARLRRWVRRRIARPTTTPLSVLKRRSKVANDRTEVAIARIERFANRGR